MQSKFGLLIVCNKHADDTATVSSYVNMENTVDASGAQ